MWREIGKLDLGMKKKSAEQRSKHRIKSHLLWGKCCREWKGWDGKWHIWSWGRKSDQKVAEWPVLLMAVITRGWGGRRRKRWGLTFFCLPLFSAGSQQLWVWTAGERIDVSFYGHNTPIHLWQQPWWRERPMGWRQKMQGRDKGRKVQLKS